MQMTIAYRSRGRGIVCHIVIRYIDLSWILLALPVHDCVSHWLREALPVSTLLVKLPVVPSHMRVLKNDNLVVCGPGSA